MADRLVVGCDHVGMALRAEVIRVARGKGFEVEDLGPNSGEKVDYPDFARRVGEAVGSGKARFGILTCGTGIGMCIAANKIRGVRAAVCTSEYEARMARSLNDANVLCMGERVLGLGLGAAVAAAFLEEQFAGGKHQARVDKVMALERL
jgi:ribose 5-phosphate isomerase B